MNDAKFEAIERWVKNEAYHFESAESLEAAVDERFDLYHADASDIGSVRAVIADAIVDEQRFQALLKDKQTVK